MFRVGLGLDLKWGPLEQHKSKGVLKVTPHCHVENQKQESVE